ncbi:MAG: hypothetical protein ACYDCK_08585 [Thermoplasmatota archaeon]
MAEGRGEPGDSVRGVAEASPDAERLARSRGLADVFDVVKRVVERELGKSRAGMMLALADFGASSNAFLGGYFVLGSNAIVLNRTVLRYVDAHAPRFSTPYAFHVLLHEYLHTIGYYGEDEVRPLALKLSERALGADHPATRIARAMSSDEAGGELPAFFRDLVYPPWGWTPDRVPVLEIVKGFDRDASPYIA